MPRDRKSTPADALTALGRVVALRPVRAEDHPLFLQWQNDPEIAGWMDYRKSFTLRGIERDQARAAGEGHPFAIEVDGRTVGKCGLNRFRRSSTDPRRSDCAMYIYVGEKDLWGRGIGRDAVMTLCATAFDRFRVETVELSMISSNDRARRAYEACGFRPDPDRRPPPGSSPQAVMMSVGRADFERARSSYGI